MLENGNSVTKDVVIVSVIVIFTAVMVSFGLLWKQHNTAKALAKTQVQAGQAK